MEVGDTGKAPALLARRDQPRRPRFAQAIDLAQAEPQRRRDVAIAFEAVIPAALVDVDRAHLDAVILCIADDLRGRVKPHRLRVEQPAGEGGGVMAFEPARHIDEMRKARRMAFGKAIFAEAANLVEAALRKIGIVAARDHPPDHLVLQLVDHPARAERRHRLAQLVGLGGREFRGVERDLHRLFLEDRHAQRPVRGCWSARRAGRARGRAWGCRPSPPRAAASDRDGPCRPGSDRAGRSRPG